MDFKDEQERLVAEQAVLAYRAVNEAADAAKFGHGMEAIEDAALAGGREQMQRVIRLALSRVAAEKDRATARGAGDAPTSSGPAAAR
jgi:hypothetical protein